MTLMHRTTCPAVSVLLIQCLLLLMPAPGAMSTETSPQRPNIIFIFADDWGWGDLSCHGNEHYPTPNLDRMAAGGIDFHQFTVANPVCSPSRTAVMTGQYPARHSVHRHFASIKHHQRNRMPDWLDPQAVMLPRLLQQAGYRTAHFGKWHLTNRDISDAPEPPAYGYDEARIFNGPGPQLGPGPAETVGATIDFITRNREQSFFVNLWLHETHTPHYPAEEFMQRFGHLPEGQREYASVIAEADEWIGRLLTAIDELSLTDNTLIIFSSDNGPENTGTRREMPDAATGPGLGHFYSRGETAGLRGRKRWLAEGGIRAPFLVYWPGQVPAERVDTETVLNAVDLLPSLCALADAPLPADYQPDGENMLPALLGKTHQRTRPIFYAWLSGRRDDGNWMTHGVRDGRWKLHAADDRYELFDIFADRSETTDLAAEHPAVVARLAELLSEWRASLPDAAPSHCFSAAREQ